MSISASATLCLMGGDERGISLSVDPQGGGDAGDAVRGDDARDSTDLIRGVAHPCSVGGEDLSSNNLPGPPPTRSRREHCTLLDARKRLASRLVSSPGITLDALAKEMSMVR